MIAMQHVSQRVVAKTLGISRNTVKKYCDGNSVPREHKDYNRESNVLNEDVLDSIFKCFEKNKKEGLQEQSHTANASIADSLMKKISRVLNFTICTTVKKIKGSLPKPFIPLEFDPGEAMQIDWGEATI